MADPSVVDLAKVAQAMEQQWRDAEIRPPLGLERASVRDGDLYIEQWATAIPKLHRITVRRADLLATIENDPDEWSAGEDPNYEIASWLYGEITETLDSSPPFPTVLTFDPESGTFSQVAGTP